MGATRAGFSMIEVLVAVVIASVAGMALMESAAQGRRAYDKALTHRDTAEAASLVALSSYAMGGSGQSDVEMLISSRYAIDNSRINNELKTHPFMLKTQRSHNWDGSLEGNVTQRAVASISKNAIERTMIEIDGVQIPLYGLSGEGW